MRRPKYKSADDFERDCIGYFEWCDLNPIRGQRSVRNKDGEKTTGDDMLPRPYTIEGLCDHLLITNWSKFVSDNYKRDGFADVIDWVRNKVRRNQIEGGMVGIYQPNLTARINGLADNINTTELPAPQFLDDEDEE